MNGIICQITLGNEPVDEGRSKSFIATDVSRPSSHTQQGV